MNNVMATHISGNLDQLGSKLYTNNEEDCVGRRAMLLWLNANYNRSATIASFHCTHHVTSWDPSQDTAASGTAWLLTAWIAGQPSWLFRNVYSVWEHFLNFSFCGRFWKAYTCIRSYQLASSSPSGLQLASDVVTATEYDSLIAVVRTTRNTVLTFIRICCWPLTLCRHGPFL
jgi:hypothetical protein